MAKITLTTEKKYQVADSIASAYNIDPSAIKSNYNFYFRELINAPISVKNKQVTLTDWLVDDDARHVTALVLKRLATPQLQRVVAKVEYK